MNLTFIILGFVSKLVFGLDDLATQVPLMTSVTHTKRGRLAFAAGIFLSVVLALILANLLVRLLAYIPFYRYVIIGMLLLFALAIYFDMLVYKPEEKVREKVKKIPINHTLTLFGIGFIASFAALIDDLVVYTSLFSSGWVNTLSAVTGILIGTGLEIFLVLMFSKSLKKLTFHKEIASTSLIAIALLMIGGII